MTEKLYACTQHLKVRTCLTDSFFFTYFNLELSLDIRKSHLIRHILFVDVRVQGISFGISMTIAKVKYVFFDDAVCFFRFPPLKN